LHNGYSSRRAASLTRSCAELEIHGFHGRTNPRSGMRTAIRPSTVPPMRFYRSGSGQEITRSKARRHVWRRSTLSGRSGATRRRAGGDRGIIIEAMGHGNGRSVPRATKASGKRGEYMLEVGISSTRPLADSGFRRGPGPRPGGRKRPPRSSANRRPVRKTHAEGTIFFSPDNRDAQESAPC